MTLPNLPQTYTYGSSMLNHNNEILYCVSRNCWQLNGTTWTHHSKPRANRDYAVGVSTNSASFLFGSTTSLQNARWTYDYLEVGTNEWVKSVSLPTPFHYGCGVAVSDEQILLIGGFNDDNYRIWSFNTLTHSFTQLSIELNTGRGQHACSRIPNTEKILVAGGSQNGLLSSSEIIDMATQSVSYTGSLNFARRLHGMGIMTIGNKDKVIVFGGDLFPSSDGYLDTIEVYNEDTQSWELLGNKLSTPKFRFGYLSIMNTGDTLLTFPTYWTITNSFVIICFSDLRAILTNASNWQELWLSTAWKKSKFAF